MPTPSETSYLEIDILAEQVKTKICSKCKTPQLLTNFYAGHRSWCKDCCRESTKTPPKKQRIIRPAPDGFKVCSSQICVHKGEPQLTSNFTRNRTEYDGWNAQCKECDKARREANRQRNQTRDFSSLYAEGKTKICSRPDCSHNGVEQSIKNFYKCISNSDGLNPECKDCSNTLNQKWQDENQEKCIQSHKDYYKKNREKINAYCKEYHVRVIKPFRALHWAEVKVKQIGHRARQRNLIFSLEPSDLLPLPEICPIFGVSLDYAGGSDKRFCASVDRIKPEIGYVKGNVRVISMAANMAKNDGDDSIFSLIKQLHLLSQVVV